MSENYIKLRLFCVKLTVEKIFQFVKFVYHLEIEYLNFIIEKINNF